MILLLLALALSLPAPAEQPLPPPAEPPLPARLAALRGHVVVLNFWATWCKPCRTEMPLLAGVHRRYAARGVVVVGASADDESTRARVAPFIEQHKIDFPIWTGATTAHMLALDLGADLPATAVINRDGQLAGRIVGQLRRGELDQRLDALLAGRPLPKDRLAGPQADHGHSHGGVGMEGASMVPS